MHVFPLLLAPIATELDDGLLPFVVKHHQGATVDVPRLENGRRRLCFGGEFSVILVLYVC